MQFVVINLDDPDYHNLILTTQSPPYSSMPMMSQGSGMMYWNGNAGAILSMMPMLGPTDYKQGFSYSYSYSASLNNPSTLWYYCDYTGHAQSGMYGKIVVIG